MTIGQKKELGAYYTPDTVTDALCGWAIREKNEVLLEPSFGGCNFLVSSIKYLSDLGANKPHKNIYGCDIDKNAFSILKAKHIPDKNFKLKDFLLTRYSDFNRTATAILGNPPFLPIHKLNKRYKSEVMDSVRYKDFKIDKKSSIWVHFIVHSLNFLKKGGKMAWVVPDSIFFANYGKSFLAQLSKLFQTVKLLRIDERFFSESGTLEKTSILLCDGFEIGDGEVDVYQFSRLNEALSSIKSGIYSKKTVEYTQKNINSSFRIVQLGDIFDIKIGIVLGATKLLTLRKFDIDKSPFYPNYVYPIITKGGQLHNLSIDIDVLLKQDVGPIYLINGIKLEIEQPDLFAKFLESFSDEILNNQTFKKRGRPFGYDDFKYPDAFFTYFTQKHPRIIENKGKSLNCTNSVHRLYFRDNYKERNDILRFIVLQTFVNYSQSLTESFARKYGNSILKFEPSDARKIPIIIPTEHSPDFSCSLGVIFSKVIDYLDKGNEDRAHSIALAFIEKSLKIKTRKVAIETTF